MTASGPSSSAPTGRSTWLDPAWRAAALAWVEETLARLGRSIDGPVEQPHVRPWSTAFRVPTNTGPAWFKATGPGTAHEGPLLEVFRAQGVGRVVLPLAVHPDRPWLLFDDAGSSLRATRPDGHGDHDLAAWNRILPEYAELQRSVEEDPVVAAMLAAGTPDGRPAVLPGELARLLDDDTAWGRVARDERNAATRARLRLGASFPAVESAITELAELGVRPTVQHDDLHGGNILVGPAGDRFFDWGDAIVAHPFSTLTVTFNSIAHTTERSLDDPVFGGLRDAYLEAWTGVAPRAGLLRAVTIARDLGCIGRSLAWERALGGLTIEDMDGFGDAVAGWLMELADRLEGPAWTA